MLFSVWLFSKNFVLRYFFFLCCVVVFVWGFICCVLLLRTYLHNAHAGDSAWLRMDTKTRYEICISLFSIRLFWFCVLFHPVCCYSAIQYMYMIFLTFGLLLLMLLFISFYEVAIWLFFLFFFFFFALCHLNNEIRYWDEENMVSKSNWERELMHITEINSLAVTFADRFLFVNGFLFRHSSFRKCYYERAVWMCTCMCALVCLWQRKNELSIVSTWNRDQHFLFRFNAIQK